MQAETLDRSPRSGALIDPFDSQPELEHKSSNTLPQHDATDTTETHRSQYDGKPDNLNSIPQTQAESIVAEASSAIQQEEVDLQSREAAEVAAAARFISQIDNVSDVLADSASHFAQKPRLGSSTSVRDSIMDSTLNISKSRIVKSQTHVPTKRSKMTRPAPLQLEEAIFFSEEVQSPLPERSSSKGAPSFDLARSIESAAASSQDQTLNLNQDTGFKSPLPVLTPESAKTFQFDFDISNEPRLSRSESGASTASQSPPTPATGPSDDQVRKDIEAFALEQGPYLRGSHRRVRRPPALGVSEQKEEAKPHLLQSRDTNVAALIPSVESIQDVDAAKEIGDATHPVLRRKKSIFGWLQKKPEVEVDDLLDLYLTDEQLEEVKTVKPKSSKPKKPIFRSRNATDPLPFRAG